MKYYAIVNSWNKKKLGIANPSDTVRYNTHIENPDYIGSKFLGAFENIPIVPNVILKSKAKITDLIFHTTLNGLINKLVLSTKLKEIIEHSNAKDIQFFKSNLIQNKTELSGYWIMHPCKEPMEAIDFPSSRIFISGVIKDHEQVQIHSLLHFKELNDELKRNGYKNIIMPSLRIDSIQIKDDIVSPIIILGQNKISRNFFVSEKLKSEIEKENCTGIEFIPSEITKEDFFKQDGYRHKNYGYWPD